MSSQMVDNHDEVYRIIAENTTDTIVLVDNKGIVIYASPSLTTLTGYEVEQYKGFDAFEMIPLDERNKVRDSYAIVLETKVSLEVEYRLIHLEGHQIYVETRVRPVLDDLGAVKYVVAVVRDVTERKQTEQLLENILDNINAVVWSIDKDFVGYKYVAGSFEKLSGFKREEVVNNPMRIHDHIHPDDNAVLFGTTKEKLDAGLPVREQFRWSHIMDETRWGQMFIHPHIGYDGEIDRLDGMIIDITEKKRSEIALEESEQRYKSLFENNLDGVFTMELDGYYIVNANPVFEDITGFSINEIQHQCFIGMIHDEHHELVYEVLHKIVTLKQPKHVECNLAYKGGNETIVSITFVPIFLSGQLNGIHGIIKDITKQKKEQHELIRKEERSSFLQQSLNRLSNDLANVMRVSELEERLLEELKIVLNVKRAFIEEDADNSRLEPLNPNHVQVKIGVKQRPVYLYIELEYPLYKIEEEWLDTVIHYVTILYDNLHRIEDLMMRLEQIVSSNETPKWMIKLLFKLSEKERASLSSDLHDSVLQDLIIWYRKLESLRSGTQFESTIEEDLMRIEEGLLDAIHQLRITCNELRPPFLLKMGLVESLKSLFAYTRMFSNYEIDFHSENFHISLNEDQILGIYRIVQELLNNASKHSKASKVIIMLSSNSDTVYFQYDDDGVGINVYEIEGSFQHMGIAGIEKRVLSLEGEVSFNSAPNKGFHVIIEFPMHTNER